MPFLYEHKALQQKLDDGKKTALQQPFFPFPRSQCHET